MRKEKENLIKLFLITAKDIDAALVKLTARSHNVNKENALETLEIYAPIADRLGAGKLKSKLEDAAFKCLYPKEYKYVETEAAKKCEARAKYINKIKPVLQEILEKEKIIPIDISARAKHLYSLYKKLLRCEMDFEKVRDLVAARVIAKDINDCYLALGAIHQVWKPVPGLMKDYIARPKINGYQSLHTWVFGPEERITEIQIRTPEMHARAEEGIAAHWAYKEKKIVTKETAWVGQLRELKDEAKNSDQLFESLKVNLFDGKIFVLTPKGNAVDLPEGATPIDFAYYVHTTIGNECAGAKINGKIAALDTPLKSGDLVEILTQKGKKPKADWLSFVKTNLAKDKIRSLLREKNTILRMASRKVGKLKKT